MINLNIVLLLEEKQANSELPENKSTKKPKPMYPKDYERKVLLDREGYSKSYLNDLFFISINLLY